MIVKILYRFSQKFSCKTFFQNPDDLDLFIRSKLVQPQKTGLLPGSGVDVNRFFPLKKRRSELFQFLLFGRLLWEKGIREYVEAAKIVKARIADVEFQLLGVVDDANPRCISESQLRVWEQDGYIVWLGSADDVRPFIAAADCVVLPSYREGTPRSLLEAASMGKPLITTNTPGCKQVVEDGENGYLCEAKDPIHLASVMEKMLNMSEERRMSMGEKGRNKMVVEFDEKIVSGKYLETINKILNSKDRLPSNETANIAN